MNISPLKKQYTPNKLSASKGTNQLNLSTQNLTSRTPDKRKNVSTTQSTHHKNSPSVQTELLANSNQVLIQRVKSLEQKVQTLSGHNLQLEQQILEIQAKNVALREQIPVQNKRIKQFEDLYLKNQEEIQQLHSLLRDKNNTLIQWQNKFVNLEKKYEQVIQEQDNRSKYHEQEQKIKLYELRQQQTHEAFILSSRQMKTHLNQLYLENEKLSSQFEETQQLLIKANAQIERLENENLRILEKSISSSKQIRSTAKDQIKQNDQSLTDQSYELQDDRQNFYIPNTQSSQQLTQERQQRSQSTHENQEILSIRNEFQKYQKILLTTQQKLDLSIKNQSDLQKNMRYLQLSEQEKQRKIEQLEQLILQKERIESRLTDREIKITQLEAENQLLIKQKSEKQQEIEEWVRRIDLIQQDYTRQKVIFSQKNYSRKIEDLHQEFNEFRKSQSEKLFQENQKQFEKKVKVQQLQIETARQGVIDINEELQEKDQKIEELSCVIEQLQKDNYDLSVNLEQQTDRFLKLQLAIHQAQQNYDSGSNGEFSFQQIRQFGQIHRNSEKNQSHEEQLQQNDKFLQQLREINEIIQQNEREFSSDQQQNQVQMHTM